MTYQMLPHRIFVSLLSSELAIANPRDSLLFSKPTWSNGHAVPSTIIRNITAHSLGYTETIVESITTLSTNFVPVTNGIIQGLLYVPDLKTEDSCFELSQQYIPANATRQADLPPTDYILIALVPWINTDCTRSFMDAAFNDPLHAMVVYLPDDGDDDPPGAESNKWKLDARGAWKENSHFPVYAISSSAGERMMQQVSLYSGPISQVPFANEINQTYSPDPGDYVRIWTQLTVAPEPSALAIWALVLIILGVILSVVTSTSLLMYYTQIRRRALLRRRVLNGEVNLEALGIKHLTIPLTHVQTFPLFTYQYHPPILSSPSSGPSKSQPRTSLDSASPSSSHNRGRHGDRLDYQPTCLICSRDFESEITIIRELSCGHIFHPECIDEFLTERSSLCPLCKLSMYPHGHCPEITNSMVRRELATRKLRLRRPFLTTLRSGWQFLTNNKNIENQGIQERASVSAGHGSLIPLQKQPSASGATRDRMQELVVPIDETSSDDGRTPWKRAALILFPLWRYPWSGHSARQTAGG